jgi:hypothetical protein
LHRQLQPNRTFNRQRAGVGFKQRFDASLKLPIAAAFAPYVFGAGCALEFHCSVENLFDTRQPFAVIHPALSL